MQELKCSNCGSNELTKDGSFYVCNYCGTKHILSKDDVLIIDSSIELNEDVLRLIRKMDEDPNNSKKYAQLILQIDPHNRRARAELNKSASNSRNSGGGCYIATAVYGSYDCPEVWTLRRYRDNVLAETSYGRLFIKAYYAVSPTLVKWFGSSQLFQTVWKHRLDRFVFKLNNNGFENTPYEDRQ